MSNSDTLDGKNKSGDDFISMGSDLLRKVNWKIAVFIFIAGIFIFSDVFIANILTKCNDCENDGIASSKGTMVQLMFMSIFYILIDLMSAGKYL